MSKVYRAAVVLALAAMTAMAVGCGGGGPEIVDDPELASSVTAAFAEQGVGDAVYEVTAESDGGVIVTLSQTKDAMGGEVYASDVAAGAATIIFRNVPEATSVGVFDANNKIIDVYEKP